MAKRPTQSVTHRNSATSGDEMLLQSPSLAGLPWLVHGFTTRRGGVSELWDNARDLNLGKVEWDNDKNVLENRRRMKSALGAEEMHLITLRQIHSDVMRVVDDSGIPKTGDALMTARPGVLLSVVAADCLPILLADTRQRIVAAVHCGWRGTVKHLAQKTVGRMRMLYGSNPKDILAAIGPGIRSCCYQVGVEVYDEFQSQFADSLDIAISRYEPRNEMEKKYPRLFIPVPTTTERLEVRNYYLDLVEANRRQLLESGIPEKQIQAEAPCTSCNPDQFFSHRRDAGRTGRMMGVIGIKGEARSSEMKTRGV